MTNQPDPKDGPPDERRMRLPEWRKMPTLPPIPVQVDAVPRTPEQMVQIGAPATLQSWLAHADLGLNYAEVERVWREAQGVPEATTIGLWTYGYAEGSEHQRTVPKTCIGHISLRDLLALAALRVVPPEGHEAIHEAVNVVNYALGKVQFQMSMEEYSSTLRALGVLRAAALRASGAGTRQEEPRKAALQEVRAAIPTQFWGSGSKWEDGTDAYRLGGDIALKCVHSILDRLEEMSDADRITRLAESRPMSEPRDAPAHYDNAQASAWADGYESGRAAGGQPPSDGPPSEKARDAFSAAFFTECILRHAEGRVMEGDVLAKAIDLGLVAAYKVDHGR